MYKAIGASSSATITASASSGANQLSLRVSDDYFCRDPVGQSMTAYATIGPAVEVWAASRERRPAARTVAARTAGLDQERASPSSSSTNVGSASQGVCRVVVGA